MRIKSNWHNNSQKSIQEMASAISFSSWRLTKNQLEDLINEGFNIETNEVFGIIKNYLFFIINCVDRIVFIRLSPPQRKEFIIAIVKQLAFYYDENKTEIIKTEANYMQEFIDNYNQISMQYNQCSFTDQPDYNFIKVFAGGIQQQVKNIDKKWIAQQIIEIQAPKTFKQLAVFTKNIVTVENIIDKTEKSKQIKNKIPRSKRKK